MQRKIATVLNTLHLIDYIYYTHITSSPSSRVLPQLDRGSRGIFKLGVDKVHAHGTED